MASYTDKIPTFNPYVAQQPVEAMLKVGMYKQQKYEEGVQKIQTSIDNVAGLDIANPVQQQYLQSKLNALGNNLRWVAGGDFSDFQLVNSVNGMTKQITKDEDVVNAVSSTARLRAGYKKRAELEKKGLTDKNNDDYYDKDASAYVNNTDIKASFNSEYVPYTNIVKKLQEALVGAGETELTAEQLFVTGSDGKPLMGPDGHYQYADVKTIDKLVTNKPAVLAAINNVLGRGDVKQQLGIDGWATYRNTEATSLLEPLKGQYDADRSKLLQDQINNTALMSSTNLSPEEREAYATNAIDIEGQLSNNNKTFLSLSEQAENNPEEFKQNYYAQDFKQNLITQFTKNVESHTTGVNEGKQEQNWRQTFAFNEKVESNKIAYQNATLDVSRSTNELAWLKFRGDYSIDPVTGDVNKKPEPGKGTGKPGTINANTPIFKAAVAGDKVSAINIMQTDISKLSEDKGTSAFSMYADLTRASQDNYNLSDDQILASAKTMAKQEGITYEVYINRWAKNISNEYAKRHLTAPPNLGDELNNFLTTSKSLNNKMAMMDSAKLQANKEAGVDEALHDMLKDKNTLNFTVANGNVKITPQEMMGLITDGTLNQLFLGYGKDARDKSINKKNLTANQNKFLSNWYNLSPEMKTSVMKEYSSYAGQAVKYSNVLSKANDLFNEKLGKIVGTSDAVTGSLPMGDADEVKASVSSVNAYVTGGERSFGPGTNKENIIDALNDPTGISWVGKKPTNSKEQWSGQIKVTSKGKEYTINDVNHEELQQFTGLKLIDFKEKPIEDLLHLNEKTKSTNAVYGPSSPKAWTTSYFKGNEVDPSVTAAGWVYRADAVKAPGGGYRLVNYVKAPGSDSFVTIYGNSVAPTEDIIDTMFKTTLPKELEGLYITYLQNQKHNKQ